MLAAQKKAETPTQTPEKCRECKKGQKQMYNVLPASVHIGRADEIQYEDAEQAKHKLLCQSCYSNSKQLKLYKYLVSIHKK